MTNAFPSKTGVSQTESPSLLVEGKPKLDLGQAFIPFGAYALVYTGTDNTMNSRAVPAVALKRSNSAGGHYFMSLYTGKRIHGYKWKELPIDEYVIDRVETLAEEEKQPIMKGGMPIFEWGPGEPIEDDFLNDEEITPMLDYDIENLGNIQIVDEEDLVQEEEPMVIEQPPPPPEDHEQDEDEEMYPGK